MDEEVYHTQLTAVDILKKKLDDAAAKNGTVYFSHRKAGIIYKLWMIYSLVYKNSLLIV